MTNAETAVSAVSTVWPGMVWHPFNHAAARELAWILDRAEGAAFVWFPHREQLWFYPIGVDDVIRTSVIAELVSDPRAREWMRQLIREATE